MFSNLNVLRLNLILGVFSALKFKKKYIYFFRRRRRKEWKEDEKEEIKSRIRETPNLSTDAVSNTA